MSLRRDIHSAFDAIAPPTGGLAERVVQTVLVERANRRRKEKMLFRFRAPLSLVAVFLLIALVAAALIGGRLIQDWNTFHRSSPAGSTSTDVAQLEARPLHLPSFSSVAECNSGPFEDDAFVGGPIHAYPGRISTTGWGDYYHNVFYTDQTIAGPILIRARDLFRDISVVFVGKFAAGPTAGTDVVDGNRVTRHTELILNEDDTNPVTVNPPAKPHPFVWGVVAAVPKTYSGSTGWQIDGPNFSAVFLAC